MAIYHIAEAIIVNCAPLGTYAFSETHLQPSFLDDYNSGGMGLRCPHRRPAEAPNTKVKIKFQVRRQL
jgi:hypothetical protein